MSEICPQCESNANWNQAAGYTELAEQCRQYCRDGHKMPTRNEVTAVYCNDPSHAKLAKERVNLTGAEEQRRSFAYGNTAIENPLVTRELVDEVADAEAPIRCLDCGMNYETQHLDFTLSAEQWKLIHPEVGGVLCATCIVRRAAKIPHVITMMGRIVFAADYKGEGPLNPEVVVLAAALASALGQLRACKDTWMAGYEASPSVDAAFAFRRCADSLAPIIRVLEEAKK